jgi:hypothetical protein
MRTRQGTTTIWIDHSCGQPLREVPLDMTGPPVARGAAVTYWSADDDLAPVSGVGAAGVHEEGHGRVLAGFWTDGGVKLVRCDHSTRSCGQVVRLDPDELRPLVQDAVAHGQRQVKMPRPHRPS